MYGKLKRGIMKKFLLLTLIILSAGLAALATGEHPMDTALATWVGTKARDVVKIWGQPTDIQYEQGQTKYIWAEEKARYIPGTQYQKKYECNRIFIIDTSGRVVYTKFTGNGCPFTTESANEYSNPNPVEKKSRYNF